MTTNTNINTTEVTVNEVTPQLVFKTVAEARQAVQEVSHPFAVGNTDTHRLVPMQDGTSQPVAKAGYLATLSLAEIKGYCRANNIKGFGTFTKEEDKMELINHIVTTQEEVVHSSYEAGVDLEEALAASYDIEEGKYVVRSINDIRKYITRLNKKGDIDGVFPAYAEINEHVEKVRANMIQVNRDNKAKLVKLNASLNKAYAKLKANLEVLKLDPSRANDKLKFEALASCKVLRKEAKTIKDDIKAIKVLGFVKVSLANVVADVTANIGGNFSDHAVTLAKHLLEATEIVDNAGTEENYTPIITAEVVIGLDTAEIVKNADGKAVVMATTVRTLLSNPTLYTTGIANAVAHLTKEVPYVRVSEVAEVVETLAGEQVEQDMYVKRLVSNDLNDVKFQKALDLTGYVTSVKFQEPSLGMEAADIETLNLMRKLAITEGVLLNVAIEGEELMHVNHLNMSASESRQGSTGHAFLGDMTVAEFSRSLEFYLLEAGKRDEKKQVLKVNADKIPGRLGGSYKSDGQLMLNASEAMLSNMVHERVTDNLSVISNGKVSIAVTEALETVIDKGRFAVTDKDNGGSEVVIDLEEEGREITLSVGDGMSYADEDTIRNMAYAQGVRNVYDYLRTHTFRITGGAVLRGMMMIVKNLKAETGYDIITTEDSSKVNIVEGKAFDMTYVRVIENKATHKEDFRKVSSQVLVNTSRAVQQALVDINREAIDQYKEDVLALKPTNLTRTAKIFDAEEISKNQAYNMLHSTSLEMAAVVPEAVKNDARLLATAYNASKDIREAFLTGQTLINQTFRFIAHDPGLVLHIIMNNLKAADLAIAKGSKDDVTEGAIFKFRQEDHIVTSYGEALKENEVFVQNPNYGNTSITEDDETVVDEQVAFDGLVMGVKYPYIDSRQTVLAQGANSTVYTNAILGKKSHVLGNLIINVKGLAIFSAFSADIPGASNADFDGDKMAIILDERITKAYYDAIGGYSNYSEKLVDYYTTEVDGEKVLKSGIPWSATEAVDIEMPPYASVDAADTSEVIIDLSMLDEATRFDFSVEPAKGKYSYKEVENFVYAYRDAIAVRTLKPAEVGLVNDEMSYINEVITHCEYALTNGNLSDGLRSFIEGNLPSLKHIGRTFAHYIQYVIDSPKHGGAFRHAMKLIQEYLEKGHPLTFMMKGFDEATGNPIYKTYTSDSGKEVNVKLRSLLFRPKYDGRMGYTVLNTPLKANRDYAVKVLAEIEDALAEKLTSVNTRDNLKEAFGIKAKDVYAELGSDVAKVLLSEVKKVSSIKLMLDISIGATFGKGVKAFASVVRASLQGEDKQMHSNLSLDKAFEMLAQDLAEAKRIIAETAIKRNLLPTRMQEMAEEIFNLALTEVEDNLYITDKANLTNAEVNHLDSVVRKASKTVFAMISGFAQSELLALAKEYEKRTSKEVAYQAVILFAIHVGIDEKKQEDNKTAFNVEANKIKAMNAASKTVYMDAPFHKLYAGTSFFYTGAAPLVIDLYGNEAQREAILGKYYADAAKHAEESTIKIHQDGKKTTSALVLLQDAQTGLIQDEASVAAIHFVSKRLDVAKANGHKLPLNFYVEKTMNNGQPHFTMKLVSHTSGAVVNFGVISKRHASAFNQILESVMSDYDKFTHFHVKSSAVANRFAQEAINENKQHFIDLTDVVVTSVKDFAKDVEAIVAMGKQVRQ